MLFGTLTSSLDEGSLQRLSALRCAWIVLLIYSYGAGLNQDVWQSSMVPAVDGKDRCDRRMMVAMDFDFIVIRRLSFIDSDHNNHSARSFHSTGDKTKFAYNSWLNVAPALA